MITDTKPAAGDAADGSSTPVPPPSDSSSTPVGEVYGFLVDHLALDARHRRELQTKRGFDNRTVEGLQFRSVGPQATSPTCLELQARYSPEALVESRLFERVVGGGDTEVSVRPASILTSGGILIPYIDYDRQCVYVRRHKYGPKNAPIKLYTPCLDPPKDRSVVYLCEGEFKAAALTQLGFWAIATPGVASFVGEHFTELVEWLRAHESPSVVVVFDTEDKANPKASSYKPDALRRYDTQVYAMRLALQLESVGFSSRIATLPMDWDAKRIKVDCDSALATGKGRAAFQHVFEQALSVDDYLKAEPSVTDEARRVLTARLTDFLMSDYSVTFPDDKASVLGDVTHHGTREYKGGETKRSRTRLTDAPLWISAAARTESGEQHFLEVAYTHRDDGRVHLRSSMERREDVLRNTELIKGAARGMPVNSTGAAKVVTYLSAAEAAVGRYLPTQLLVEKNGWVESAEGEFVVGERHFAANTSTRRRPVKLWVRGPGERVFADALEERGDLDAWRVMAKQLRDASPTARISIAAAFAAPLIHILGTRSFVLHLYGPSGGAKSAVTKFATSAFGDPKRMMSTFHTTINAIERTAQLFSDLPLWIDELQLKANPEHQKMLTYLIASGQGKMRMARDGGLRETVRFRNVALSTGEQTLVTDADLGGQDARVLELYGRPLDDDDLGRAAHDCAESHHGHAGPRFLEKLVQAERHEIQARYRELFQVIAPAFPGVHPSKIAARSVLALADILTRQWVFDDTTDLATLEVDAVILDHELFADRAETQTPGEKAMDATREWLATNPDHIQEDGRDKDLRMPVYARVLKNGGVYLPNTLWKGHMEQSGIEPSRVIEDWKASGWIEVTAERRVAGTTTRSTSSQRINGTQCRVVIVNAGHIDITHPTFSLGG